MATDETGGVAAPLRLASRLVLATSRGPVRALWTRAALALARRAGRRAAAGVADASVYTRGGLGRGDFVPGLSDVDVIVVAGTDPAGVGVAAEQVRERWYRAQVRAPRAYAIFGEPRVHDDAELAELVDASAFTFGLDAGGDQPAFVDDHSLRDRLRLLDKPGLVGATDDWRLLAGRERRPPRRARQPEDELVAAWLELAFYWRHAYPACVFPGRPRTPLLCVKIVAEPARILLRLTTGERFGPRSEVLRRALQVLPEEEPAFRLAIETERALPDRPRAPLEQSVAALWRLSRRIAETVTERAFARGADTVELAGALDEEIAPLCDWRAVVSPTHLAERVRHVGGASENRAALGELALEQDGPSYVALRDGALLALPATVRERNRLRAVQCAASDPVTFAVLEGRRQAAFPRMRGWSIEHVARRAVAEHRARLAGSVPDRVAIAGAARAALLWQSVRRGEPTLQLTTAAIRDALDGEPHLGRGLLDVLDAETPPDGDLAALARAVNRLPAYS